jgi:hypothetical protein
MAYERSRSNLTIFANPKCIQAWCAEAQRVISNEKLQTFAHAENVFVALELLQDLYCLQNPQQKNPLQVRSAFFNLILQASTTGFPLAMFFEGLALKEGFGCRQDILTGQALIQVAGARKCAEALNYLALCCYKDNLISALSMLRDAAHDGHSLALGNFRQLAEHVRIQLRRRRKIIEFSAQSPRMRASL